MVDRIVEVEKTVQVPVERMVEKRIVEKRVEMPVEKRIVEKRVEVPVECVEKRVVERTVQRGHDIQHAVPFVGLGLNESLQVYQVYNDGPAWNAGVRLGDEVLEVGHHAVHSQDDVCNVIRREAKVGRELRIVLRRAGEIFSVALPVATTDEQYRTFGDAIYYDTRNTKFTLDEQ